MAKRIILYNLVPSVTDEEFKKYVLTEKGPLFSSLPGVEKYELVKISGSMSGKIPYKYVGILSLKNEKEFNEKAPQNPRYQAFLKKFGPMATDLQMMSGDNIY